eukprot:4187880-Prymnesium_polylepis.1
MRRTTTSQRPKSSCGGPYVTPVARGAWTLVAPRTTGRDDPAVEHLAGAPYNSPAKQHLTEKSDGTGSRSMKKLPRRR